MTDKQQQQQQIESLNGEIQILQKKLDSKTKAFGILINELDALKHERDQFKALADSLQETCVQLKKQAINKIAPLNTIHHSQTLYDQPNDTDYNSLKEKESIIHLLKSALKTIQDEKEVLQTKLDELTRELNDVKGDLLIFRQKRSRSWQHNQSDETQDKVDQAILLAHLEQSNERIIELESDFKSIVCQKEELEIERDSFKIKYQKLNQMFHGNENGIVDIELVLSENRYLQEKINELTREKTMAVANATKYKDLLQTHRSTHNRLGKLPSPGSLLTPKQVRSLINQSYVLPNTPEAENDLRSIAEALLENVKDKNLTIVHQRKINKILANRITELEKLLVQCKFTAKSEQASALIDLLDQTPDLDIATSQFAHHTDHLQQLSPTQGFTFLSTRLSEDDVSHKTKDTKTTVTLPKSTLDCYQSESTDLEMDDPLQSPTLTTSSSMAYLSNKDLLPSRTLNADFQSSTADDIEHLQDLLNQTRQPPPKLSNSTTVTNLTC